MARSYIWVAAVSLVMVLCADEAGAKEFVKGEIAGNEVVDKELAANDPDTLANGGKAYTVMSAEDYVSMRERENRNFWQRLYHYFADANKKNDKRFDVSVIGGPHYSSNTKLGIGVVAAGVYSTNREDSLTPLSNVSLYGDVTTTGYYIIGIRGNNIFTRDRWRIDYSTYFNSYPSNFWGLGYTDGNNDNNKSDYLRREVSVSGSFLYGVAPRFFIGPSAGFEYVMGSRFSNIDLINGEGRIHRAFTYGAVASYDTRDNMTAAYSGIYAKLAQQIFNYPRCRPFFKTEVQFNYYKKVWKGCVLATDLYSTFGYGNVPWTSMALLGGTNRMRGYYEGRYRDNNMITFQAELRQHIYNRHGVVVWVGAGNVWGDANSFGWSHTLPNFGFGYRWEFKKRMNVRLDYGMGKSGQSAFMFAINEAF